MKRVLIGFVVVVGVAACTSTVSTSTTGQLAPSTSEAVAPLTSTTTLQLSTTSTSTVPQTTTTIRAPRDFYERQCGSRIGEGYGPVGSGVPDLYIGPVALLAWDPEWLATEVDHYTTPDDEGRYEGIKYVLVVNHEAVGPVAVSIPEPDRGFLRLVYDPDRSRPMWEEADHTVKFGVCDHLDAQFNGGIVVSSSGCGRIMVVDEGVEGSEWIATLAIGVPVETCQTQ